MAIVFEYRYEERGGTAVSSRELGVDEHIVIKTLVMEDERKTRRMGQASAPDNSAM